MSAVRWLANALALGPRETARSMLYIGDPKRGTLRGTDSFGNRYFENTDPSPITGEVPGRHRWVDFSQGLAGFNASQIPPEWHSWLSHIRALPPTQDPVVQAVTPPWQAAHRENLTGTRAAYKSYSTTKDKYAPWTPTVRARRSDAAAQEGQSEARLWSESEPITGLRSQTTQTTS